MKNRSIKKSFILSRDKTEPGKWIILNLSCFFFCRVRWSALADRLMTSGLKAGFLEQTEAASSQLTMSRSTRCLAPNSLWTVTHQAPPLPSPLDHRVQDDHCIPLRRDHRCHISPPLRWAQSHLHLFRVAPRFLSHTLPYRPLHQVEHPTARTTLLHPTTTTATGLLRAPKWELCLLPLSHQHTCTKQELRQQMHPDTLMAHRSAALSHSMFTPALSVLTWQLLITLSHFFSDKFSVFLRVPSQTRLLLQIHLSPHWTTSVQLQSNTNRTSVCLQFSNRLWEAVVSDFFVLPILDIKLFTTTSRRIQMSWSSEKEILYTSWRSVMMDGL